MTEFDPYRQQDQAGPVYPPSAPVPQQPWGTQPYPVQPYAPQPVYVAQPYPAYAAYQPLTTSGMAVAGMVVGIVALVLFWVPFVDLVLGFLAIGLSWGGMVQADRPGYTGKGMGIAGLVCGIIAVIPAVIVMLFFFGIMAAAGTAACTYAC
ncbi:hypothetical protein Amsp01_013810 [Amycolatopsis sp. NBRC 101858]|uniref:DUF4190 domain-containing protein n=1 Tax=Amycolatopsis sp. NBRC 101858 TaxID=3032200 RepID=UPI0024A280D2|nr:DUF4190 domain-containing protein [Amycolatopsis sp. NBRC 101858]GLY35357.1 hypothetical protein Amsp01_013810 [Amycolatopsis sp. NBRC 101858]